MAACIDRNYKELGSQKMNVISPEKIVDCECDMIVVANSFAGTRREIKRELEERYPEKKIYVMDEELVKSNVIIRQFGLI